MPARIHRNVRSKVHRALFHAALDYLLERAEAHIQADTFLLGDPLVLAPKQAFWTVERNILGVSFVRACIRFTDGSQIDRAWKVPNNGLGLSKDGCGSLWTQNLPLDKYRKLLYPDRARGWAVVARGGAAKRSTRTRPAVGRAFKRRGR